MRLAPLRLASKASVSRKADSARQAGRCRAQRRYRRPPELSGELGDRPRESPAACAIAFHRTTTSERLLLHVPRPARRHARRRRQHRQHRQRDRLDLGLPTHQAAYAASKAAISGGLTRDLAQAVDRSQGHPRQRAGPRILRARRSQRGPIRRGRYLTNAGSPSPPMRKNCLIRVQTRVISRL